MTRVLHDLNYALVQSSLGLKVPSGHRVTRLNIKNSKHVLYLGDAKANLLTLLSSYLFSF